MFSRLNVTIGDMVKYSPVTTSTDTALQSSACVVAAPCGDGAKRLCHLANAGATVPCSWRACPKGVCHSNSTWRCGHHGILATGHCAKHKPSSLRSLCFCIHSWYSRRSQKANSNTSSDNHQSYGPSSMMFPSHLRDEWARQLLQQMYFTILKKVLLLRWCIYDVRYALKCMFEMGILAIP